MMKDCLQWRLQYEPHRIMFSDVREEAESGKLVLLDWHDKRGNAMVLAHCCSPGISFSLHRCS